MENKENQVENNQHENEASEKKERKPFATWKDFYIFIAVVFAVCLSYYGTKLYHSDWLVNQTMNFKSVNETKLGKNLSYHYSTNYNHKHLYIKFTLNNVDEKIMEMLPKLLSRQDGLVTIKLLDKKNKEVISLNLPATEFKKPKDNNKEGTYVIKKSYRFPKKIIKQIKSAKVEYQPILDMKYETIAKSIEKPKKKGKK